MLAGGLTVLNWLISITSASFFSNWIIISFTNWRFHCALKAQNDKLFSETYAWKSDAWPLAPAWLMLISVMLLVCCIYSGINPVVSNPTSHSSHRFDLESNYTLGHTKHKLTSSPGRRWLHRRELLPVHDRSFGHLRLHSWIQAHLQDTLERPCYC